MSKLSDSSSNNDEFPYRSTYMPTFKVMFRKLQEIIQNPPNNWIDPQIINNESYIFGIVDRLWPDDYENVDSLTDHYVEPIRILCRESNQLSPYEAWSKISKCTWYSSLKTIREKREAVYNSSRGCNLFNTVLAGYIINRFGERNNVSILDCCAGWGDRLVAAHASSNTILYRGWDTNSYLQPVYKKLSTECGTKLDWDIVCKPFETAGALFVRNGELYEKFSIAFICPPFFTKELYLGQKTSTNTYNTLTEWNIGFYKPMLKYAQNAIKPGGYIFLYIIKGMYQIAIETLNEMQFQGVLGFRQICEDKDSTIRDIFIWQKNAN
jgi:hypothetical protein